MLLDLARESTRPASVTLISGALYSLLVKFVGSKENDPTANGLNCTNIIFELYLNCI